MVLDKRSLIKKFIISIFTCFILFQPIQTFAETKPILDKEQLKEENKPGIVEKHLSKLLINTGNWLLDLSNAQDVTVLVFQRQEVAEGNDSVLPNKSSADRENMYFGIFPSGLFDAISAFNTFFTSLLPIPMVVLLSGGGLFLLLDIMKSNEVRSKVKEILFGVVVAIMMVRFGHIIWGWIIDINYIIVDGMYVVLTEAGIPITRFTNTIWDSAQFSELTAAQSIGVAIMILAAVLMTFTLNYQYMMRMIQLAMLMVLFPPTLLSAMIPSRKSALNIWFTTFTSNIFIQAGHSVALGLFFYSLAKSSELSFWLVMTMLLGLPAMADLVNRIVSAFTGEGAGGGLKTSASNMSGMAGLMAISKIGSTIAGGRNSRGSQSTQSPNKEGVINSSSEGSGSHLSADSSMAQSGGTAPVGSDLKGSSNPSANPQGRGARTMQNLSSLAKGVSKGGRKLANSNMANSLVRAAAITATTGVGAVVGTMTTGSAGAGAFAGSQFGRSLGVAGNYAREKLGKGIEHVGEVARGTIDQKLGQVEDPYSYTKDRLGYTDNAQLYDSQEMGRMGEELIGGRTGRALGKATGNVNNFIADKLGSPEQKSALNRVRERQSLPEQISHSRGMQEKAKQDLDTARLQHNHVASQYGPNTESGKTWMAKSQSNVPHPKIQESQKQLDHYQANYNQHAFHTRQLEQKQANFYRIKQQAEDMKSLQSQVRSSGRL